MVKFLRAIAGLALGTVIFAGLLFYLVVGNVSQRLENPQVYQVAISDTGAYSRIYDEVLVDAALRERTGRLLGNMEIATHEEAVQVLRDIMPPAYLREQTEDNIDRFTGYLRHESEDLELYVSLTEPLDRIEPVALGEVHQFIDGLEVAEPESSGCSVAALQRLAADAAAPYAQLSQGQLPQSAPSLKILSREFREREFDRWFGLVVDDPLLNSPAARILQDEREELRRTFVEGDTRGFLKAVAEPAVEPLTAGDGAGLRRNLQPNDRFDLLEWVTDQPGGPAKADIEAQAESLRDVPLMVQVSLHRLGHHQFRLGYLSQSPDVPPPVHHVPPAGPGSDHPPADRLGAGTAQVPGRDHIDVRGLGLPVPSPPPDRVGLPLVVVDRSRVRLPHGHADFDLLDLPAPSSGASFSSPEFLSP